MTVPGRGRRLRVATAVLVAAAFMLTGGAAFAQTPPEAPDVEVLWELMVLSRAPRGVQVAHLMHVVNAGPRVATSVPLSIPQGARWLDVPDGLIAQENRAVDPHPLRVGEERRYMVVYEIPWQQLPMAVRRELLYPTYELNIWVRAGELQVRGVNVLSGGTGDFDGVPVEMYAMVDLEPHPQWQIVLDSPASGPARLPELSPLGHRSDPVEILRTHPLSKLLLGVVVLGAAGVVRRYWPAREAARSARPGDAGGRAIDEREDVAALKEEIVRVDVAFRNGELDEATYRELRRELKERLLTLMSAQGRARASGGERP